MPVATNIKTACQQQEEQAEKRAFHLFSAKLLITHGTFLIFASYFIPTTLKKRLIFTYRPLFYSLTIPFAALIITACGKSTTVPKAEATDTTRYALAQETGPGHDEARSLPPAEAEYAGKHYVMNVNITPCDSLPMVTDDFGDPFQDNIVECQITLDGNSIAHQRFTKADFADAVITADHIEELILGGMAFDKIDAQGIHFGGVLNRPYDIEGGVRFRITFPLKGGKPAIVRKTANNIDEEEME